MRPLKGKFIYALEEGPIRPNGPNIGHKKFVKKSAIPWRIWWIIKMDNSVHIAMVSERNNIYDGH
jgi:hypothetical protein